MTDKELLKLIGLEDRTINIGLNDEYAQMVLEKRIDAYLKKIDEEKKKQDQINYLKSEHEKFQKKKEFLDTFNDSYVYNKVKNELIKSGFIYQCKFCWGLDVSGQYGKRKKEWNNN